MFGRKATEEKISTLFAEVNLIYERIGLIELAIEELKTSRNKEKLVKALKKASSSLKKKGRPKKTKKSEKS